MLTPATSSRHCRKMLQPLGKMYLKARKYVKDRSHRQMMDLTEEIDRPRITKVTVKRDAVGTGKENLFCPFPEKGSRRKNHFRLSFSFSTHSVRLPYA